VSSWFYNKRPHAYSACELVEMQAGQVAIECQSIYWLQNGEFPGRAVHAMPVVCL
jgi:hypothetical protein